MKKQIFAMGGGGFSMNENPALDRYFFSLAGNAPKVCFLGTASGDAENYIQRFYSAMKQHDVTAAHLSLFKPHTTDIESFIFEQDVIYVGGGNTKNLITLWKAWGLDQILFKAYESGCVLGGLSAGAICWFEQGVTDSLSPPDSGIFHEMSCLGLLRGSCCPHFDGETTRRAEYRRLINESKIKYGYAIDDDAALHFIDGELHEVVSARAGATAYEIDNEERPLDVDVALTHG